MRIVAVIDLKWRIVVHGVGGNRDEYRPLVSGLTPSSFAPTVAQAFRDHLGLDEIYLADLDAIAGADVAPTLYLCELLSQWGFHLWVDAGIRTAADADPLARCAGITIVAALETLAGPQELATLCTRDRERTVFSLDLKQGKPLTMSSTWPTDPWAIAEKAIESGCRRLLVLDLARVGAGGGTGTEDLCRRIVRAHPEVEVSAGGGVRGIEDLIRLQQAGISAVLVASALHDGRLRHEDLKPFLHGRHS